MTLLARTFYEFLKKDRVRSVILAGHYTIFLWQRC